jgi:putative endonuclease
MTNNLEKRVAQHKAGAFSGFSKQYATHRLVWFERYDHVQSAITREKQLKGWRREKKNALIQAFNPAWADLSADWGKPLPELFEPQGPSTRTSPVRSALAQDDREIREGKAPSVSASPMQSALAQDDRNS